MELRDFPHHLFVDCKPSGRIHEEYIMEMPLREFHRLAGNLNRRRTLSGGKKICSRLRTHETQLLNRCRSVDVTGDGHYLFSLGIDEPLGEFPHRRRLAGTLQAGH